MPAPNCLIEISCAHCHGNTFKANIVCLDNDGEEQQLVSLECADPSCQQALRELHDVPQTAAVIFDITGQLPEEASNLENCRSN